MPNDTHSVSYITNTMRGAPVLKGSNDGSASFIAVLDALLVTGWGMASVATLSVSAGIATAKFVGDTPWEVGAVIEVSGATPGALNGRTRVLTSVGDTLTFATSASDGTYGGSIGIKYAPAGWEKSFSGPQKAAYRSLDVQGIRHYYRFDESINATRVYVSGAETMDGIDSAVGIFNAGGAFGDSQSFWDKVNYSYSTNVPYVIAADSRAVLAYVSAAASQSPPNTLGGALRGCGDAIAFAPAGDAWCSFLSCPNQATAGCLGISGMAMSSSVVVMARAQSGAEGVVQVRSRALSGGAGKYSGNDDAFGAVPMGINGKMLLSRMAFMQATSMRAGIPGVVYIPHNKTYLQLPLGSVHEGAGAWAGRRLMALQCGDSVWTDSEAGRVLLDLTGPWRDWSLA